MTKETIREREKEKQVEVIGTSPAGNIEKIPNLKKRQRSVYYRPDGQGGWLPTQPLPSDAAGRELYLSKGFLLNLPADTVIPKEDTVDAESLITENALLKKQLVMANARAAKKEKSLSSTL